MLIGYVTWGVNPLIYYQSAFSALTFLSDPLVEKGRAVLAYDPPALFPRQGEIVG